MISQDVIAEVRRLLSETPLSQRKIAALTGVSRGTIGAIAAGRRPDYEAIQSQEAIEWDEPEGPPERCGGCGGMVYMPCRLCAARKRAATKRLAVRPGWHVPQCSEGRGSVATTPFVPQGVPPRPEETTALDLRPEHRARYEEVCAWRRKNGGEPCDVLADEREAVCSGGCYDSCQGGCR